MSPSLFPPMAAVLCLFFVIFNGTFAQLSTDFYSNSCPSLYGIVHGVVRNSMIKDLRAGPKLVNLHFRDCFVNGCDASILLDSTDGMLSEKDTLQNAGISGMDIIDDIKAAAENHCPGTVSCADILALASQIAINEVVTVDIDPREAHRTIQIAEANLSRGEGKRQTIEANLALTRAKTRVEAINYGGPLYNLPLGRRDSTTANSSGVVGIPGPSYTPSEVISLFNAVGLDETDVVVLSGAHTFGGAQCGNFQDRLYNFNGTGSADPNIDLTYLLVLRAMCPGVTTLNNTVNLDPLSPYIFDNRYYVNLLRHRGLLQTDQDLFTNSNTSGLVAAFANNQTLFFSKFGISMVKMGNISPLTGSNGVIRANCHLVG